VLTSITISPLTATIGSGETQQFTGQALDQFGQAIGGVTVSFTSNNTTVATVDSVSPTSATGSATATVTGHANGSAEIRASATNGSTTVMSSPASLTVVPAAGEVLISEFRTRGPGGAADEFIEIYNPTTFTLVIGGLALRTSNSGGNVTTTRATIPAGTTLGPGCHYLFAPTTFSASGVTPPDQTISSGLVDDGGIAITRPDLVTIIDQVGTGISSAFKEGTTLTPLPANNSNQSYERRPGGASGNGVDTNNNANDFIHNSSTSNPQNLSSGCLDTSAADLAITKTDSPDPVTTGSNVTYTIVVTNTGPADAQSVVVTDNLPGTVSFVSCSSTGSGVCNGTGNNRTITFSTLTNGASETITLVATANGSPGSTITNTSTVASVTPDSDPTNSSSTTTTNLQAPPPEADLSVAKTVDTATPVVGQDIVFTITLNNGGPSTATAVQVTDLLPSGLLFLSSTVSQGTYDNSTGLWNIGTVNNLGSATLNITARVQTQGAKTNTAAITASGATDPNSSNNQSSVTFTPNLPLLAISQLYTAGGAASAVYNRDFIEIFNRGTVPINLSGFSIQYAASGTSTFTVIASLPNVTLAPRQYFLISAGTSNAGIGANFPVPADVTGSNTNMTGSVGKVAIVFGTSALTSSNVNNPPLTVGNPSPGCPTNNTIVVDFIGYGTTAACFEGTTRAPDPTATNNSQSDFRNNGGCTDTNDNGADFTRANALPRNSSTTKLSCP
jgi:uncharacterized repeat protein (TIGR01451 family)